jgi:hypothetical protein
MLDPRRCVHLAGSTRDLIMHRNASGPADLQDVVLARAHICELDTNWPAVQHAACMPILALRVPIYHRATLGGKWYASESLFVIKAPRFPGLKKTSYYCTVFLFDKLCFRPANQLGCAHRRLAARGSSSGSQGQTKRTDSDRRGLLVTIAVEARFQEHTILLTGRSISQNLIGIWSKAQYRVFPVPFPVLSLKPKNSVWHDSITHNITSHASLLSRTHIRKYRVGDMHWFKLSC